MRVRNPIEYLWRTIHEILYQHPNGVYYEIVCLKGKQKWTSLETTSLREAKTRLRRLKAERAKTEAAVTAPLSGPFPR